jgi:solute carrier family 12 (sodium/potassium/chloride transporter), member 2
MLSADDRGGAVSEAEEGDGGARRYGTFEGVFVPTLLTILGVILYLRTGWVVGNAGLLGAILVVAVSFLITGLTALSLASISTNVTPSAGGAYALVARSFGVEAGGAVGVSLYLSQSLVIVLYLFGFRDGWLSIFPDHSAALIDAVAVLVLVAITLVGARTAFRVQYLILAVVTVSIGAIVVAVFSEPYAGEVALIGSFPGAPEEGFPGTDLFGVFAVFFPATTGIMAGLNMSGELKDARRSLPVGTLAAVGVSFVIYLGVAVWLSAAVPVSDLTGDYLALADASAWPPGVLAGLLAATFSSALASLVGAPRILQALAADRVTPASSWLAHRAGSGEPRHALIVTVVVVVAGVLLRDLNAIAQVITMVFLLAYGAINAAVLSEIVVDLPSYRPTLRVPWPVPLLGALGCFGAMLVINPWAFVGAVVATIAVLIWVSRRDVVEPVPDIRSAMLMRLARWATRTARGVSTSDERTWSPRFLVPVRSDAEVDRVRGWLPELAEAGDLVRFVPVEVEPEGDGDGDDGYGADPDAANQHLVERLRELGDELSECGADATTPDATVSDGRGPSIALAVSGEDSGAPVTDVVIAGAPAGRDEDRPTRKLLRDAFAANAGVVLLPDAQPPCRTPRDGDEGQEASDGDGEDDGEAVDPVVALWLAEPAPMWHLLDHLPHADLALLVAYRLARSWEGSLRLVTAVGRGGDREEAEAYLQAVVERARLPGPPECVIVESSFADAVGDPPDGCDLHVLALSSQTDFHRLREVQERIGAPCLFVRDSGVENAFA